MRLKKEKKMDSQSDEDNFNEVEEEKLSLGTPTPSFSQPIRVNSKLEKLFLTPRMVYFLSFVTVWIESSFLFDLFLAPKINFRLFWFLSQRGMRLFQRDMDCSISKRK